MNTNINLAGIIPISTVDWPGKSCITIFLRGCNFRCIYCHNVDYLDGYTPINIEEIQRKIDESRPFISAVVFSGGDPLIQYIQPLIIYSKQQGLSVGIHTNGCFSLLEYMACDYPVDKFFIDIKAPFDDQLLYSKIAGVTVNIDQITTSIYFASRGELELRTTVFKDLIGVPEIENIAKWISENAPSCKYVIQRGRGGDEYTIEECMELKLCAEQYHKNVGIR